MPGQRGHRTAVDSRRVQQPALRLVAVPHLAELAQVGAYHTQLAGEPPDRTGQAGVFEVLEDLLPVADRPSIVQWAE